MSLDRILNASSIAVIGASKNETKRGYQAIKILLEEKYEGSIYPINPNEESILGLKCYPSIMEVENPVDIALITTPANSVPPILKECGKKGVQGVVIIAGGFGEIGDEGKKLEEEILKIAKKANIRILGPNTSGIMNLKENLNLVGLRDAPRGDIALLTQSGNMALSLITESKIKSLKGFSYYIGVGNELDIKFHEFLEFLKNDPDTKAILIYVEGLRKGREFLQEAYKTTIEKPIILLKSGRSKPGQKSAGSHTGALAGISEVARTAFKRAGIIVIENSDELFPVAETLSSLPPIKNNSIAVLADGGGHATIAADLLTDMDVSIPPLAEQTQIRLKQILPAAASVRNPVDMAGGTDSDPTLFAECARIILNDSRIGGLLIVGLFGGYGIRFAKILSLKEEDAAHRMGKLVAKRKKPIVVHSLYTFEKPHSLHLLRYYNIPVYDSLDVACKCVGALSDYGNYLRSYHGLTNFVFDWGKKAKPEGNELFNKAIQEKRRFLFEHEAKQLLQMHDIQIPKEYIAQTAQEAGEYAKKINGNVALKIISPDILHKSDAGGVQVDLSNQKDVHSAFNNIMRNAKKFKPDADIRGILVTPMVQKGLEVIIGTKVDDQFGPVIMFGLGGIHVEILKDVSFRVLPISPSAAAKMIDEIKSSPLLNGFRGVSPCDKQALKKLLLKISELIEAYPQIQEMDLNPVVVHENGLRVVDAKIILKP